MMVTAVVPQMREGSSRQALAGPFSCPGVPLDSAPGLVRCWRRKTFAINFCMNLIVQK